MEKMCESIKGQTFPLKLDFGLPQLVKTGKLSVKKITKN